MKKTLLSLLLLLQLHCSSDGIRDKPISFSEWRAQQTLEYVKSRYGVKQQTLEMLPVMVVSHYTAMDSLDVSFNYMNREQMEEGRSLLKKAGSANIAVHFLVGKAGDIYRLMPENHIGRHVIGLNRHAIGIENVGANEESLTMAQVEANALIVRRLAKQFPIRYLIAHSEYRKFENTPLWEEMDNSYRTEKFDPGESFMVQLRQRVADLGLSAEYDRSEISARARYILRRSHERGDFSGVALVIDNDKIVLREAFGKNVESGKALKPEDRFYLASAAKPLTALAVAQLEGQGKISYETAVAQFFPGLKHLLKSVRIKHLLAHTSGLDDYYGNDRPAPGFSNADALVRIAAQKVPLFSPGKKFHYSNANYVLLAEIVANVGGTGLDQFASSGILLPAGMQNTAYLSAAAEDRETVAAAGAGGAPFRYPYKTLGPGGVATTVDDLASLNRALWEYRLLPARALEKMLRPVVFADAKKAHYGFGWYVLPKRQVCFHDGNFNGYHTTNWLNLKKKQAIILLANRPTAKIRELAWELDRALNGLEATPPP